MSAITTTPSERIVLVTQHVTPLERGLCLFAAFAFALLTSVFIGVLVFDAEPLWLCLVVPLFAFFGYAIFKVAVSKQTQLIFESGSRRLIYQCSYYLFPDTSYILEAERVTAIRVDYFGYSKTGSAARWHVGCQGNESWFPWLPRWYGHTFWHTTFGQNDREAAAELAERLAVLLQRPVVWGSTRCCGAVRDSNSS